MKISEKVRKIISEALNVPEEEIIKIKSDRAGFWMKASGHCSWGCYVRNSSLIAFSTMTKLVKCNKILFTSDRGDITMWAEDEFNIDTISKHDIIWERKGN